MRTPLDATTSFYGGTPGLGVLRVAMAASQRLWPALAVRAAGRVFLTPLPLKWMNRRTDWGKQWSSQSWPFERTTITLHMMDATGPVVLLVHGWGGHAGQLRALAQGLAAQGMRPVIIEMPGHGHSGGWRTTLPQFSRVIDYVCARLGQQGEHIRMLLAHSLGANASAYVAGRGLPVERLVLVAPAASPPAFTHLFAQVAGLSERTRAAMQRRIEAREGMLMAQFDAAVAGPRIRVPTLVVHDRKDTVNRFADGQAFADAIEGAQLLATEGLGHRALLKDPDVIAKVVAFSADHR